MRELDSRVVFRVTKLEHDEVTCFAAPQYGLQTLHGSCIYGSLAYLDLSMNEIKNLEKLRENFPSAWWMNFRKNQISELRNTKIPIAIGQIILSDNPIDLNDILQSLSQIHILRMSLAPSKSFIPATMTFDSSDLNIRSKIVNELKYVWVLDDDFITTAERNRASTIKNIPLLTKEFDFGSSRHKHLLLIGA